MKHARYLVRFDDLCPTMNWSVWSQIAEILAEAGVVPILAVVPDNKDAHLVVDSERPDFWDQVRCWQTRGWTVGMHGYQHDYVTVDPGIVKLNPFSEFAGLPTDRQRTKLRAAKGIFDREGVTPRIWIAPAHSFDAVTVSLLREVGIGTISDGFGLYPSIDRRGILWIPQQIWRFRPLPVGVFTVCLHHNGWTQADVSSFRLQLAKYRNQITSLEEIERVYAGRLASWLDRLASAFLPPLCRWKRSL